MLYLPGNDIDPNQRTVDVWMAIEGNALLEKGRKQRKRDYRKTLDPHYGSPNTAESQADAIARCKPFVEAYEASLAAHSNQPDQQLVYTEPSYEY